jgi:hypothetical protein
MVSDGGLTATAAFVWGCFGGVAVEALQLYNGRDKPQPHRYRTLSFWVVTVFFILVGGGVVLADSVSAVRLTAVTAIQLGISAPLLLRTGARGIPKPGVQASDESPD